MARILGMKKLLSAALLTLLCAPLHAKTTTYDWTGQVSDSRWKVALNDMVHGTIELDDDAPRTISDGQPDDYRTYQAARFTFVAGGQTFNSGGTREWSVLSGGQGLTDCALPDANPVYYSFNWNVGVRNNSLDLFATNLDQEWTGGRWGMEVSDPEQGYFANGFEGVISTLTRRPEGDLADAAPVPEPSTFMLMGSALAGLGFFRRKRSRR